MMKLKDILEYILKDAKRSYNMATNPDSIHNRSSAMRAGTIDPDDEKGPYGGAQIMQILGIEDEGPRPIGNKEPMYLMDLTLDTWEGEDTPAYEDEDGDV